MTSLQQNNSAIAEMVKSRDLIIDELNDRVAVFEEDKVVLKAALKQLQKEIKEEGPRTQQLLDDLDDARKGKASSKLLVSPSRTKVFHPNKPTFPLCRNFTFTRRDRFSRRDAS